MATSQHTTAARITVDKKTSRTLSRRLQAERDAQAVLVGAPMPSYEPQATTGHGETDYIRCRDGATGGCCTRRPRAPCVRGHLVCPGSRRRRNVRALLRLRRTDRRGPAARSPTRSVLHRVPTQRRATLTPSARSDGPTIGSEGGTSRGQTHPGSYHPFPSSEGHPSHKF